ncbi:hypothetical protein PIB30_056639 [Stylosanthes scabra]|uniref:Uncharacterized protein n=1 Tax=Stylosanthes scabra TaxID=79078 RepID=A0ABU6RJC7_9FABA|nr:hypothetical protein [Stylosanthes scabra]
MELQFDSSSGDVAFPNDSANVRSPNALPALPDPVPLPTRAPRPPQRNKKKVAARGRSKRRAVEEPPEDDTTEVEANETDSSDVFETLGSKDGLEGVKKTCKSKDLIKKRK